jgi:hypothetical protein
VAAEDGYFTEEESNMNWSIKNGTFYTASFCAQELTLEPMGKNKLNLTRQNLDQIFNPRSSCALALLLFCSEAKVTSLELKTWHY